MFQGFSQATGDFIWGLAMNNNREWFLAHKDEFEAHLNQPFRALAFETLEKMQAAFPDQEFQTHLARIYRDARRLFGRGPYKDHLWFSIQSGERRAFGPMFWFEIGGTGWSCGAGNWEDSADVAEHWRRRIDAETARFERIVRGIEARGPFVLYGEAYKRPKADKGELLNRWYNRKHLSVGYEHPFGGALFTPGLTDALADAFTALMPFYLFLRDVWNDVLIDRAGR